MTEADRKEINRLAHRAQQQYERIRYWQRSSEDTLSALYLMRRKHPLVDPAVSGRKAWQVVAALRELAKATDVPQ